MSTRTERMSADLGDGIVTVWREGSTAPIVANVLGIEPEGNVQAVYLDRLVHNESQEWSGWTPSGCVSTVLRRPIQEANT